MGLSIIREALQSIIERSLPEHLKLEKFLDQQVDDILKLGIKLYKNCDYDDPRNCFGYALGIPNKTYVSWCSLLPPCKLIGSTEVNFLKAEETLKEINNTLATAGNLVIYLNEEKEVPTTHGGLITESGNVYSKWGCIPAIFEHKLDDVPTVYGNIQKYYTVDSKKLDIFVNNRFKDPYYIKRNYGFH